MRAFLVLVSVLGVGCHAPRARTTPPAASIPPHSVDAAPITPRPQAPRIVPRDPTLFAQPVSTPPSPQQPYPAAPPAPQDPYGAPPPPFPAPAAYAYPPPPVPASPGTRRHDGEVIADFAAVGTLASIDLLIRQDVANETAGTLILLAGLAGGAGAGWLLTEKYEVDGGAAHATTLGLLAGAANGALLIEPTESYDAEDVMALLFVGSAVGAAGGFAYGQLAKPTPGQSVFLLNATLLGTATAGLGAITGSRDGELGTWESGTLALGLDAGLVAGAVIAPRLDWSSTRAKQVLASTAIGALVGGLVPGLVTTRDEGEDYDGHLIAGSMTAGLWGGFALGVLLTRDQAPDARYLQPGHAAGATTTPSTTSLAPWVGNRGQLGLMAGGNW